MPIYGNDGQRFARELFAEVRAELMQRFGGLTVYSHAPVQGLWQDEDEGAAVSDELVIFEVMSEERDKRWWASYRKILQGRFQQRRILIRSCKIRIL